MPESNEKKFKHNVQLACSVMSNKLNEQNKCANVITKCYKTKCTNEGNKLVEALLTQE